MQYKQGELTHTELSTAVTKQLTQLKLAVSKGG